ncbi:MAG: FKBP-type peptidyl-prolyl cis-trans isomerase [Paludibacteraceae bacterium]|nr:FKBP-type peptidyl-prolyl cis-trans isomerase [Paludibacteraceae bacterium]MBO7635968.1 FKBP-type peptidyl-prolyl cis-trans isomerase [Paludibacteraceae bacterium]MBR5971621.1 FKBP-type peptidyl-prolyl cis-trans isomerase [Paludibacteraceae bacterium]
MDSVSYAIGMSNGIQLKSVPGVDTFNVEVLNAAFEASYKGDSANLLLTEEQTQEVLTAYFTKIQMKAKKEIAAKNKLYSDSVLKSNGANEGVITLENGLQYRIIKQGSGQKPKEDDVVKVNYVGKLLNGRVFDSTIGREPVTFNLMGVIKGWSQILQMMPVGSKYEVWIPSDLAYGDMGMGNVIEPGSTLYFEVELLGIQPAPAKE